MKQFEKFSLYDKHPMTYSNTTVQYSDSYEQLADDMLEFVADYCGKQHFLFSRGCSKPDPITRFISRYVELKGWQ